MGNAIFISYRRDDTEGEAGRLFDDLTRAFGNENVFMDVAGIRPGADFRRAIDDSVTHCGVFLAIIGPTWATIANPDGMRRLEDPNDFVALEIGSALKREVPVIPVLVHGAHMPAPEQLPDSLKDLSYRNSVELSHPRWNSDVQLLVDALNSYVKQLPGAAQEPVHAAVPVQLPAPHPAQTVVAPAKKKSMMIPFIAGAAAVVVLCVIGFLALHRNFIPQIAPGPTADSGPTTLVGKWKDPEPRGNNSLSSLTISGAGSNLSIEAFGSCQPPPCDWGVQQAAFDGTNTTAYFTFPPSDGTSRLANVSVRLTGGSLDVTVNNTFTDSAGSRQNQVHRVFIAAQ